jgi:hypothetical protein
MSSYDAKAVTCETVHQKVAQDSAVVLKYPSHRPGMIMYNRYVSNAAMCIGQGGASTTTIATINDPKCRVMTCNTTTGKGPNKNQH